MADIFILFLWLIDGGDPNDPYIHWDEPPRSSKITQLGTLPETNSSPLK